MTISVTPKKQTVIERGIEATYLTQIKAILARVLSGKSCTVYLFGSRAAGAATAGSDFDIAVLAAEDVSRELSLAREMLEESTVPFKVDLVDLRSASAAFRQRIQIQGIQLWKS